MPQIALVDHGDELQVDAAVVDDCTSDNLEHSNTANMAQPPDLDSSHLEALPDELLMAILEQLVVDDDDRWPGIAKVARYGNFCSLCLVSKRIGRIAQPFLFKKIAVSDLRTLVKLYRTVSQAQSRTLVEDINEIDLSFQYRQLRNGDGTKRQKVAERRRLFEQCLHLLRERTPDKTRKDLYEDSLVGIMCYELLARTVNLFSLKFNVDAGDVVNWSYESREGERRALPARDSYLEFYSRVNHATRSAADGGAAMFLPRLKTLTVWTSGRPVRIGAFEPFLNLPSLRTVRGAQDDGEWCTIAPGGGQCEPSAHLHGDRRVHRNITTLDLRSTSTSRYDMEDIAQLFPCLKYLSLEQAYGLSNRMQKRIAGGSRRELSTSLGKMTALQTLNIDIFVASGFYNDSTPPLGSGNVLSLVQLLNLQHLEVPLSMFADVGTPAPGETTAVPREVLPQSLKTLVLLKPRECTSSGGHSEGICWDAMNGALKFIDSIRDDLTCFPHLETLAYRFVRNSCGGLFLSAPTVSQDDESADSLRSRLQVIKASFSKQNIQFLLDEESYFFDRWRRIDLQE